MESWYSFKLNSKNKPYFQFFKYFMLFTVIAFTIAILGAFFQSGYEWSFFDSKTFNQNAFIIGIIYTIIFVFFLLSDQENILYWLLLFIICGCTMYFILKAFTTLLD